MPISNGEVEQLCSDLRETLKPRRGEAPILARALRWIAEHAGSITEARVCLAVTSWTLASGDPMARIAFAQLVASVGLASGRYSNQRMRDWLNQSITAGLIRRVGSRGGRGQAALYRLAFVDEVLVERMARAELGRLQTLERANDDDEPF